MTPDELTELRPSDANETTIRKKSKRKKRGEIDGKFIFCSGWKNKYVESPSSLCAELVSRKNKLLLFLADMVQVKAMAILLLSCSVAVENCRNFSGFGREGRRGQSFGLVDPSLFVSWPIVVNIRRKKAEEDEEEPRVSRRINSISDDARILGPRPTCTFFYHLLFSLGGLLKEGPPTRHPMPGPS